MTDVRNTQSVAEVLAEAVPDVRITQSVAEVLANPVSHLRLSHVVIEVLADIENAASAGRRRALYMIG